MYDVLVIGTGIAGLSAAVSATQAGARVALASAGKLFSGSSFYPGTWGLGLIAPVDDADAADLADTIKRVGCGVAVPSLVDAFAHGIRPALAWLQEEVGVELMEPSSTDAASQKAFIPCFDHKHRQWRGLTRQSMQDAFTSAIDRFGIDLLERHELVDLMDRGDRLAGALFLNTATKRFAAVGARAVILATGGTSGLFERTLTSRDVLGSVQGIALKHGCSLINIEFMQMMPGLLSPARGVVFNEKTFRYAVPHESLDRARHLTADLLEMRSGYGPFTSRLASRAVDFAIDSAGEKRLARHHELPQRRRARICSKPLAAGLKMSLASNRIRRCGWACTPTPPTAAFASIAAAKRAWRACTHAARQREACTAPTV